ncbi:MAG: hypothetical protein OXC68_06780 [Aestuariivita sp.]|nr:hypothetical protein [Aestuariivita sp.]
MRRSRRPNPASSGWIVPTHSVHSVSINGNRAVCWPILSAGGRSRGGGWSGRERPMPGSAHEPYMNRTGRATGERLGIDFGALSDMALYRASDPLFKHKKAREDHRIGTVETLFNRPPVVTLYDLTNTSFEGEAAGPPKAKHGPSKERRTVSVSDAPLLTLPEGRVRSSTAAAF